MSNQYDVLVLGGGISGQEAALNLAKLGFTVLLVEKDLSIGGKMIHLSKVFPTLDCGACITTPKVSETARHPNIKIFTHSRMKGIFRRDDQYYEGNLVVAPRYVDAEKCTGCEECEKVCPVVVQDQYQWDLVGRKAAFLPFSIASPRVAAIDIENCTLCGACERACPADAIDFTQQPMEIPVQFRSVIIASGFELFDPTVMERYGYGRYQNIITSMQMERQLVPTRPFNNVLRPGDGKMPDNIAYLLCIGSRDETVNNPICSRVCCMYSIKQAQLVMGALPMADVTIYYIDMRCYGKGFEEFYEQTKEMGVEFVKGKVAKIEQKTNGDLILRYEDIAAGRLMEAEHDMVVLSVGIMANPDHGKLFKDIPLELDELGYVRQVDRTTNPVRTNLEGVFAAGTALEPMDIPDAIATAGAAAAESASYMKRSG